MLSVKVRPEYVEVLSALVHEDCRQNRFIQGVP